jgi:hypothetical protein
MSIKQKLEDLKNYLEGFGQIDLEVHIQTVRDALDEIETLKHSVRMHELSAEYEHELRQMED